MDFARGLTPHTILVLVDKPEKTIMMTAVFQKLSYKLIAAFSLYDALKLIDQEMPHLIICDAVFSDGTAGNLYDRIQQQPIFKDIPILALVAAKTKEQLGPLKGRKFAGFLLGKFDGPMLSGKVKEILEGHGDVSPFFISSEHCQLPPECTLAINAKVVGRVGDQMVCTSDAEIDSEAALLCQPTDKTKGPALLKSGSNVHKSGALYNMFPMNAARGSGKTWIAALQEINLENASKEEENQRVVFYDPKQERFEQFKKILLGYNIELIYAGNLQSAAALLSREVGSGLGCIYLDELPANSAGIAVKEALSKINERSRPGLIAGTTSLNAKNTKDVRFIKKPFGLGNLVEALDQAIKSKQNFSDVPSLNLEVQYQTPAKLLGLDETGGILQLKFPLATGSKLLLLHADLSELWEGAVEIRIITVTKMGDGTNVWQAKFEAISAQGNKSRYWERLSKKIGARSLAEPA